MNVLEIAANMVRNAVDTMSSKFSTFVKDEINAKVSSLYKPGGTATLATLPALTADNAGYVYDMTVAFTTTADFREGAGHKYPAGTNVVISDVGGNVYKYDVLSGMLDGYVQESRKVGNVPLSADIPVTLTGDTAITVTNTGTASAIGYSVSHNDSGVTAGSKGDTTNQTPKFGETFKVLSATVDAKGHVTALSDHTTKIPDAEATQSAKGLMSATDKTKLDTLIDSTLSNTGKAADAKATGDAITLLRDYLKSMEIYRKASGNPATFSDGAAENIKDLRVTITPTQSGSGNPYPPGGGKNLIPMTLNALKAANDVGTWNGNSYTRNGVTFEVSTDSGGNVVGITINGTLTAGNTSFILGYIDFAANTTYLVSGAVANDANARITVFQKGGDTGSGFSYTPEEDDPGRQILIYITSKTPISNVTFRPMVRLSDTDPTFAPYSNIRPISGATSVTVTRTGENGANPQAVSVTLTDGSNPLTVYGGTLDVTTGELSVTHKIVTITGDETGWVRYTNKVIYLPRTTGGGLLTDAAASLPGTGNSITGICNFATTTEQGYIDRNYAQKVSQNGGLEFSRVDLTFGMKSDYTADDFTAVLKHLNAGGTPLQVCYLLATPVTYQLTPQQLATLSGYNAVSSDAGSVDVTYKADTSITLGGG